MTQEQQWKQFYDTLGGEYICEECGNILTSSQYKAIRETSGNNWLLIILLSVLLTPLFLIIHLIFFGVKKKCPVCRAKLPSIFPLNSSKGIAVFNSKQSELAHLTEDLKPEE